MIRYVPSSSSMNISVHRTQNKTKKLFTWKPYAELSATPDSREMNEAILEFTSMRVKFNEVPSGLISPHSDQQHQIRVILQLGKSMKVGHALHIPLKYRLTVAI